MEAIIWEAGFVSADNRWLCAAQTWDSGITKNKPAMSVETTKGSRTLIPFISTQNNTGSA